MAGMKAILEALLFAAPEPVPLSRLSQVFAPGEGEASGAREQEVESCLTALQNEWQEGERGIEVVLVGGGYQLRTKPEFAEWIARLTEPKATRLSIPAVESLAIIAYRQPVTRPELEAIRGVDSGAVLRSLLERRLIKILGRKEEPGRPLLYGTTGDFLELFGLKDLKELPPLRELEQKVQEAREHEEGADIATTGLKGLEVDFEGLEVLGEQEQATFSELDERLSELKESDRKTQEIISPKQENEGGLTENQEREPTGEESS